MQVVLLDIFFNMNIKPILISVVAFSVPFINFPNEFLKNPSYDTTQAICKLDDAIQNSYLNVQNKSIKIIYFYYKIDLIIHKNFNELLKKIEEICFCYTFINYKTYTGNFHSRDPPRV